MERSRRDTITFRHEFGVDGSAKLLPAGTYEVESTDRQLDSYSFTGWHRISTTIVLLSGSAACRQVTNVDPSDLAAALAADKEK